VYVDVQVSSLGQGPDHVMDAISECEMVVRSEGGREEDAPWQLHYRKEMFTPWHDVELDAVATDLIYRQIIQAVHANEYRLRSVSLSSSSKFISHTRRRCTRRHLLVAWYIGRTLGPDSQNILRSS